MTEITALELTEEEMNKVAGDTVNNACITEQTEAGHAGFL